MGFTSKKLTKELLIAFMVSLSMATFSGSGKTVRAYTSEDEVLSQKTRNDIFQLIEENEGIHFREICRQLDKKMGVVQYHISVLEKNNYIRSVKDGRYKCFFSLKQSNNEYKPSQDLTYEQKQVREGLIAAIKRTTPKKIISHLQDNGKASHQELAQICEVSPQAITFHCQRLVGLEILESLKIGRQKYYALPENIEVLLGYI